MAKSGEMPNLDSLSYAQLQQVFARAQQLMQEKREAEKAAFLNESRQRARELGMTLEELLGMEGAGKRRRQRSDAGKTLAPQFRGPAGETWSGRGRTPNWIRELEQKGKKREDYRVAS